MITSFQFISPIFLQNHPSIKFNVQIFHPHLKKGVRTIIHRGRQTERERAIKMERERDKQMEMIETDDRNTNREMETDGDGEERNRERYNFTNRDSRTIFLDFVLMSLLVTFQRYLFTPSQQNVPSQLHSQYLGNCSCWRLNHAVQVISSSARFSS